MSKQQRNTGVLNFLMQAQSMERLNQHMPDEVIKDFSTHINATTYNGWSNSATWCIYMEITNNQTLYRLVMAHKGKMTIDDLKDITSHIKVESWCEGEINYAELLEELQ